MNTHFSENYLKKSIERALTGQTPENLAALTAGIEAQQIKLTAYFNGQVTEDDKDNISSIAAEVIADFPEQYSIEEECLTNKTASPKVAQFWAYKK